MERIPYNQIIIRLVIFVSLICLIIIGKSVQISSQPKITIGLGGDVMIGRGVNNAISKYGYAYPWGNLIGMLRKPDITLVNLENTFAKNKKAVTQAFNLNAKPNRVKSLEIAGIDIVNIANNHIFDFGPQGLNDSINTLNDAKIAHIGAGMNLQTAKKPVIFKENGIVVGIIGYTDNQPEWGATKNKPGINYLAIGNIEKVRHDIKAIRNAVDILIVSIHWGPNLQEKPRKDTINFAHQMIDSGVDIIHGHSSHNFQGIELYKNKPIFYDTGDLVDDYEVDANLRNDHSFFYIITTNKKEITQIRLFPIVISNCQSNIAQEEEYRKIIQRMQKLSKPFETTITKDGLILLNKEKINPE